MKVRLGMSAGALVGVMGVLAPASVFAAEPVVVQASPVAPMPDPVPEPLPQVGLHAPTAATQESVLQDPAPEKIPGPPTQDTAAAVPSTADGTPPADDAAQTERIDDIEPLGQTRMKLASRLRPGYEQLRVVRRADTHANVALQVAVTVIASAATGGLALAAAPFSKTDLAGSPTEELQDKALAAHPGIHELLDAMSVEATRVYRNRVALRLAQGREERWSREDMLGEAEVQAEADWPLYVGRWHLVYENLSGDDELYRLQMGAALGREGFMRPPFECGYQSEPIAWAQWKADDWQLLREHKAKAVTHCTKVLGATPDKYW